MRIGLYMGSFDPLHEGHKLIAKKSLEFVDRVFMIPTGSYWDKSMHHSIDERIRMIEDIGDDNIVTFKNYTVYSYTYELVDVLRSDYPDDEIFLIMGADNLVQFDKWKRYEYLLEFPFVIMKRNGIDIKYYMDKYHKDNYYIIDSAEIDISSTEIRRRLGY